MNQYQILPSDIEAEQSVIGSVIAANDTLTACSFLSPDDFYRDPHKLLWQAILDLDATGSAIDFITLTDRLRNKGHLQDAGGEVYMVDLALKVLTVFHVRDHALLVYRTAVQRRLVEAGENITKAAISADREVRDMAAFADAELRRATNGVTGDADIAAYAALDFVADTVKRVHETGTPPAMSMALPSMQRIARGWRRGEVTVLGALTNVGKTRFAYNESVFQAQNGRGVVYCHKETEAEGVAAGLASRLEMVDDAQLQDGFNQKDTAIDPRTRKRFYPYRRQSAEEVEQALANAKEKMLCLNMRIVAAYPDPITGDILEPDFTVTGLRNKLREIAREQQVDFIVIDHLSLLELPEGASSHERSGMFGDAVFAFIRLAQELQCHILLLHQLRPDATNHKQPSHFHFEESKKIAQNANNCMTLYRPSQHGDDSAPPDAIRFNLSKSRRAMTGLVDGVTFIGACSYFYDEDMERIEATNPYPVKHLSEYDNYDEIDF